MTQDTCRSLAASPRTVTPVTSWWVTPSSASRALISAQRLLMNLLEVSSSPHTLSAECRVNFSWGELLYVSTLAVTEKVIWMKVTLLTMSMNLFSSLSLRSLSSWAVIWNRDTASNMTAQAWLVASLMLMLTMNLSVAVCRVITGPDTNAADIARTVFNKILEVTGRTPALVISHLHRSRLDPNRPVEEAAQGNKEAISAYKAFHHAIEDAHRAVGDRPGLHIDFHGYRDVKKYVIYLLTFIL